METQKLDLGPHFQNCISETAFPGLQSRDHRNQDCIYGTAFPRSQESGLHFKYHGSRIHIFSTTETGLNFCYHGTGTVFPISWESAPHFQDHRTRSALPRSREWYFKLSKGDKIIKTYK